MATDYYTHPKGDIKAALVPAKYWYYMGDGDWVATAEEVPGVYTKARRLKVFLPIEQFPRDGVLMYRTAAGELEMRRVIEGAIT